MIDAILLHDKAEQDIANRLRTQLEEAGLKLWSTDDVLVGDSLTHELSRRITDRVPIVLAATARAVGARWTRRAVGAARDLGCKLLIVQMEEEADVEALAWGDRTAPFYLDEGAAVLSVVSSLKQGEIISDATQGLEQRFRLASLKTFDIIDLSNLPDTDPNAQGRRIDLRQLYVPLRLTKTDGLESELNTAGADHPNNLGLRGDGNLTKDATAAMRGARSPVGAVLQEFSHALIVGDAGVGKTTLLRWLSTAFLLREFRGEEFSSFPDAEYLPSRQLLPILVRCRMLNSFQGPPTLNQMLSAAVAQYPLFAPDEADELVAVLSGHLSSGRALLLVDGLDEISDVTHRTEVCNQLNALEALQSGSPILATSRVAAYREIGSPLRNFQNLSIADLTPEDKDNFARHWSSITETIENRRTAANELISDLHSSSRIERLTANPMLLTTLALVKRKVGRLPSRRADLYWDAFEVLLNWRRAVDEPIDPREALPQLAYVAFTMGQRGVQQLRADKLITILNEFREDFPNNYHVARNSPENFLRRLELRTGLLIRVGSERHLGIPQDLYEFRHLTFQEYLAARALIDGFYPGRKPDDHLADILGPLATRVPSSLAESSTERSVGKPWSEVLRLCISICKDEDVDDALQAIVDVGEGEEASLTARPRAIIAALCLSEEPNASPESANEIIRRISGAIPNRIVDKMYSRVHGAIRTLAQTRWEYLLREALFKELVSRKSDQRDAVASSLAWICSRGVPDDSIGRLQWLKTQKQFFELGIKSKQTEAALAVWQLSSSSGDLSSLSDGLTREFLGALDSNDATAQACAVALTNLNRRELGERSWRPTADELQKLFDFTYPKSGAEPVSRSLMMVLAAEKFMPAYPKILEGLRSGLARKAHISALGALGRAEAGAEILSFLESGSAAVQKVVLEALERLGDSTNVAATLSKIPDVSDEVAKQIVGLAGAIGADSDIESLVHQLSGERPSLDAAILNCIAHRSPGAHEPIYKAYLSHQDGEVRAAAIDGLALIGSKECRELIERYGTDTDERVRASVIRSFANISGERYGEIKAALLDDPSLFVQFFAVYALFHDDSDEAISLLVTAILDGDGLIKSSAASILNRHVRETPEIRELSSKLGDLEFENKQLVLVALRGLQAEYFVNACIELAKSEQLGVRRAAIDAIGASGADLSRNVLLNALEDPEGSVRRVAAAHLGKHQTAEVANALLNAVSDPDPEVRTATIRSISDINPQELPPEIINLTSDPNSHVRAVAYTALGSGSKQDVNWREAYPLESVNVKAAIVFMAGKWLGHEIFEFLRDALQSEWPEVQQSAGHSLSDSAYQAFDNGEPEKSLMIFDLLVKTSGDDGLRNNAAFCALLTGNVSAAGEYLSQLEMRPSDGDYALYQNNRGVFAILQGNITDAEIALRDGIRWLSDSPRTRNDGVHALLIATKGKASSFQNIPLYAALYLNLYEAGCVSKDELSSALAVHYKDEYREWIAEIAGSVQSSSS